MYKFLGLQPPTKKQKTSSEAEEKHNNYDRNICECAFRIYWCEKAMVKNIEKENKMHCVTCCEAAEVDESIKGKHVHIAGTDNYQKAMKIVTGRNKPNETAGMKMIYGLNKNRQLN